MFVAPLFIITKRWNQLRFQHRWLEKENVVHIYNGWLFSHKKNEIMPFAVKWRELEIIILRDKPSSERQTSRIFSHIWNLDLIKLIWHDCKRTTVSEGISRGKEGERRRWWGVNIYIYIYIHTSTIKPTREGG
jgi:hypothetical protein